MASTAPFTIAPRIIRRALPVTRLSAILLSSSASAASVPRRFFAGRPCTCGHSKAKPLCDGSHHNRGAGKSKGKGKATGGAEGGQDASNEGKGAGTGSGTGGEVKEGGGGSGAPSPLSPTSAFR